MKNKSDVLIKLERLKTERAKLIIAVSKIDNQIKQCKNSLENAVGKQ